MIGATALLASVNPAVKDLGWYYLLVVLLSSTLALSVALLFNNIRRRYPVFWFTPPSPTSVTVVPFGYLDGSIITSERPNKVDRPPEKKDNQLITNDSLV